MSLSRNIAANYVGAGWTALMSLAFIPVYIRYLGIEAFGLIGIFAMLQGWLVLLDLGMAPAISRTAALAGNDEHKLAGLRSLLHSVEIAAIAIAALIVLAFWLCSSWLASSWLTASVLAPAAIARAIALMGVVIGLRLIENIYRSTLIGMQRQVTLNIVLVIAATLRGIGAVAALAWVAPTLDTYFLWQCLVSVASVAIFIPVVYRHLPRTVQISFSIGAVRKIWPFAAGAMTITCLSLLLTSIDKILLSRLLSLQAFGYYAFALAVAQAPLGLVAPIVQAVYPRFTHLAGAGDEAALARAYHGAAQSVSVLLGAATAMLLMFGKPILMLWTRNPDLSEQTLPLVMLLALGSLLNGVMTVPFYAQLAAGWTGLMIGVNAVALTLVVPALLLFVVPYGAIAAAWIWLMLNLAYFCIVTPLIHRRLLVTEMRSWYLDDVIFPLAAGLVAAALLKALPLAREPGWLALQLACSAACVLLAAGLAAPQLRSVARAWMRT